MTTPRALITGITGQDGSNLAEFLLERGYEVFGLVRSTSLGTFGRIEHILGRVHVIEGDMLDEGSLVRALKTARPAEVYNLAAHSFVQRSFGQPVFTADVTGLGVARMLEAIRETDTTKDVQTRSQCGQRAPFGTSAMSAMSSEPIGCS